MDGWKEQWWMDLCSLSVSFSLSDCKDKNRLSFPFCSSPLLLTLHQWVHRTTLGQLEMLEGGPNHGTTRHHVQTDKKRKMRYHYLRQQPALCGVSSQPITWHVSVTILWFILLRTNEQLRGGRRELDYGERRSSEYKQWRFGTASSRLSWALMSLEKQEVRNRTCDICASENFFVEILIQFVQRMFRKGKKNYYFGNSLRIGVSQQKISFFLFSPCLLY